MERLGRMVRCRECREEVEEVNLKEHWSDNHSSKYKQVQQWLREGDWKQEEAIRRVQGPLPEDEDGNN